MAAATLFLLAASFGQSAFPSRLEAAPPAAGFRDFHFGTVVTGTPSGEKPESKLWWNDGYWWGSLWDTSFNRYSIHRFDVVTQSWINTGTPMDDRGSSKGDALWDGSHLYFASHVFDLNPGPASPSSSGRLYRYSYSPATRVYTLDFQVNVNSSTSETLVLDKDSSGKLWVTWVEGGKVKVNRTLGADQTWGQPFDLPVQGGATSVDDISSVVAFGGNRIGIMWSNEFDAKMYFAVHVDGNADTQWQPREEALADPVLGAVADDHINLKCCDATGALYAVTKTNLNETQTSPRPDSSQDPLIYVLRRQASGAWSRHVFGRVIDDHTRPILCLDPGAGMVYVFATQPEAGRVVYMKSASIPDLQFPVGLGTPFIDSSDDPEVNNPTSTKQSVSDGTGLLVLASDRVTRFYLHNYLHLAGPPSIASFSPASGPVGAQVEVHGAGFVGAEGVTFNGVSAPFVVDADTLLRATVPAGASTGPIAVTNPAGSDTSASVFTVIPPPALAINFFVPTSGLVGTEVEVHGVGFVGTQAVAFSGTAAGFVVDSDTLLRATVPAGASTGPIAVSSAAGSDTSATAFMVTYAVERRAVMGDDDAEESASGAVSLDSSDLELVFDGSNQRVGLRFTNVGVRAGAVITRAYVQFEADETQSVATSLLIQGQAADDPVTFSQSNKVSTRPPTVASVSWAPAPWTLVGEAGPLQRTPDLAGVIQEIVSRPGWASGNAIVMLISGSGHRTARSYEGEAGGAPLLHIEAGGPPPDNTAPLVEAGLADVVTLAAGAMLNGTVLDDGSPDPPGALTTVWSVASGPGPVSFEDPSAVDTRAGFTTTGTYWLRLTASDGALSASDTVAVAVEWSPPGTFVVERRVAAGSDDAEESATGTLVVNSADLELVFDGNNQRVGLRFTNVGVAPGAVISRAYVQFEADETQSVATSLQIQGEAADNPASFSTSSKVSTRPPTVAQASWAPAPWTLVGEAGLDQRTPDVAGVIQEIVSRPGWASGNAMVMLISGSGHRTARSYEGEAARAALLHIEVTPPNAPPVISYFSPASGPVGSEVEVHGTGLAVTQAVAFNGTAAGFVVDSDTLLRATVPAGASTGPIAVTCPAGSDTSASVFTVVRGPVAVADGTAPRSLALHQNRPNPFAAAGTTISFELPAPARVRLAVYDTEGRKVRVLQDAPLPPGTHTARWDGRDGAGTALPNGLYLLRLEAPGTVRSRKMLLVR